MLTRDFVTWNPEARLCCASPYVRILECKNSKMKIIFTFTCNRWSHLLFNCDRWKCTLPRLLECISARSCCFGDPVVVWNILTLRKFLIFRKLNTLQHREVAKDSPEAKMEILCDFERYRILIINEYRKGSKHYWINQESLPWYIRSKNPLWKLHITRFCEPKAQNWNFLRQTSRISREVRESCSSLFPPFVIILVKGPCTYNGLKRLWSVHARISTK